MPNPNFDTILSTTLYNYRETLEDNIFKANPFMYWLQKEDRFRKEDGGAKIVVPVLGTTNTSAASYNDYGTLGLGNAQTTDITAAEYPWQRFAAMIAISGMEEAKNAGTNRIINLLEAKVKQAEMSITESMDTMLLGDGSGNSNINWWGILALLTNGAAEPPLGGEHTVGYGGIARATNTFWRTGYFDVTAEVLGLARMTTAYNTVSKGNDHPDLILTEQGLYEKYESLLQPQMRFTNSEAADGGFQNLLFKGATMFFDSNIPLASGYASGLHMHFLNSKYLDLVGHNDVWFKNTPFVRQYNVDARYAQILLYGQLAASNSARHGSLRAKTA